jgi:hypothetical protein
MGDDRRVVRDDRIIGTLDRIVTPYRREGFRPPTNSAGRFTPKRARDLIYRLGLSPRRRPSEDLAADEWWLRDLADELGVGYGRFKEWVSRGYVHARRIGSRKHLVIWADAGERERLDRLRDAFRPGQTSPYPAELTRPQGAAGSGLLSPLRRGGGTRSLNRSRPLSWDSGGDGTKRARLGRPRVGLPSGGRDPRCGEQAITRRSSPVRPRCGVLRGAVSCEDGDHRNRERPTTAGRPTDNCPMCKG